LEPAVDAYQTKVGNTGFVTYAFETIASYGPNETYTHSDDGIPRLRFLALPTVFETRTVFVTRKSVAFPEYTRDLGIAPLTLCLHHPTEMTSIPDKPDVTLLSSGVVIPNTSSSIPLHTLIPRDSSEKNKIYRKPDQTKTANVPFGERPWLNELGYDCGKDEECRRSCDTILNEQVVLLYWPEATNGQDVTHISSAKVQRRNLIQESRNKTQGHVVYVTDAITFHNGDLYPLGTVGQDGTITQDGINPPRAQVSVLLLSENFTFTSPNLYLAHHPITGRVREQRITYIRNKDGSVTSSSKPAVTSNFNKPAGIYQIDPEHIFTIQPWNDRISSDYVSLVAHGKFTPGTIRFVRGLETTKVVHLAITDLPNPVPASVYYNARSDDCWGEQSHCRTITDDSFRPKLVIDGLSWADLVLPRPKDGANWICALPELVDPPISLVPITGGLEKPKIRLPPGWATHEDITVASSVPEPTRDSATPGQVVDYEQAKPTGTALGHDSLGIFGILNAHRNRSLGTVMPLGHDGVSGGNLNSFPAGDELDPGKHTNSNTRKGSGAPSRGKIRLFALYLPMIIVSSQLF
jgi:hypothetical protein